MTEEINKDKKIDSTKVTNGDVVDTAVKKDIGDSSGVDKSSNQKKEIESNRNRSRFKQDNRKPRMEFDQKIVSIRRVTRVVAGGRRFSFSVCIVIGDRKGSVGVGMGKASDTALAIEKAYNNAKRAMVKVPLKEDMSIPHIVKTKFTSSEVFIKPAPGKGVIAGGSVRTVLELAGVTDVNAKIFSRSKNDFNNAKAAIKALSQLVLTEKKFSKKIK